MRAIQSLNKQVGMRVSGRFSGNENVKLWMGPKSVETASKGQYELTKNSAVDLRMQSELLSGSS